jgi:hypothetical protein
MSFWGKLFGAKTSIKPNKALGESTGKTRREILELSFSGPVLRLVPHSIPVHEVREQPYWDLYNKIDLAYQKGCYDEAMELFPQLIKAGTLHETALTVYLRTFRKLRDYFAEREDWLQALTLSRRMLDLKYLATTALDQKKHLGYGREFRSSGGTAESSLLDVESIKDSKTQKSKDDLELSNQAWKIQPLDSAPPIRPQRWRYWAMLKIGTLAIDPGMRKSRDAGEIPARACFIPNRETPTKEYALPWTAYRFKSDPLCEVFTVVSMEQEAAIFTHDGRLIASHTLRRYTDDKGHLRCAAGALDGRLLFTYRTRAVLLDSSSRILWQVETAPPEGQTRIIEAAAPRQTDAFRLLGISDDASPDEIKAAYRHLAAKYHPDRNPDPSATERMKYINQAYEEATGLSSETAWEDDVHYEKVLHLEGALTVVMSTPGDWIYSSAFDAAASRIYLGCYSGRIYVLDAASGKVITRIDARNTVREITPLGEALLIETDFSLSVISRGVCRGELLIRRQENRLYHSEGVIMQSRTGLRFFDKALKPIGELKSVRPIQTIWRSGSSLGLGFSKGAIMVNGVFPTEQHL